MGRLFAIFMATWIWLLAGVGANALEIRYDQGQSPTVIKSSRSKTLFETELIHIIHFLQPGFALAPVLTVKGMDYWTRPASLFGDNPGLSPAFPGEDLLFLPLYMPSGDVTRLTRLTARQKLTGDWYTPVYHFKAVIAHEMGHLAFNRSLIKTYPAVAARLLSMTADEKAYVTLSGEQAALETKLDTMNGAVAWVKVFGDKKFPPAVRKAIKAGEPTLIPMARRIREIKETISKLNLEDSFQIDAAYSEFFADVVAVTYTDDPQAISKVIKYLDEEPRSATPFFSTSCRDFATSTPVAGEPGVVGEIHCALSPARKAFWSVYEPQRSKPGIHKRLLLAVFSAIAGELNARLTNPRLQKMSAAEMNARLIAHINRFAQLERK